MFQKILLSIVLFCAVCVVGFFLLIKVIDFNEYKPKIQKAIKESTGYELIIKGDITLSLSPVGISIFDVQISNPSYKPEVPFAQLGSFDVAVEIAPLFKKEIKVKHITLDRLNLSLEKTKQGKFNFDMPLQKTPHEKKGKDTNASVEAKEMDIPLVNITKIRLSNALLTYLDATTNESIRAENINIAINDIHYDASKQTKVQALSFNADASMDTMTYGEYAMSGISMNAQMKDAIVSMDNLKYTLFEGTFLGSGKLDISGKLAKISLKHKIEELKLGTVVKALWKKDLLDGTANGEIKLSCTLGDEPTIKNTLNGFMHLNGQNIHLKGYDIDKIAASFQDPKKMNFIELLNGFSGNIEGGKSLLKHVVVHLDFGYAEAKLTDVAMSSSKHRIALKGALQMIEEKLKDVKIALLDAKGCASFEQTIVGTFKKPTLKVDEKSIETIANAALSLFGKSKKVEEAPKMVENCTPFYEGLVKHPESK